jgi:selenocysteine-specific elongation factor
VEFILLGTAGHVDHGKSTLIKALSGIDPDRLKEEKEREMTIDIGFANFLLPSGRCAQVIDVPGHERFVKNMLAGVNTIDLVMFLVDANEGIKPQTEEHFDILRVLEIPAGIIVLTKIDLVGKEQIEKVTNEVKELVKGSFLEQSPFVNVSSVTGEGLPELVRTIDSLATGVRKRNKDLPVRLPIDRVFTMSGSGTVITGTLVSGILKINDVLELLPQKTEVRVRQIQSYGGKVIEAVAGQRVGLNIAGLKKDDLIRGNTLAAPGYIKPGHMFDGILNVVPNYPKAVNNNTRVRLHTGTGEFLGRIVLLDKEHIEKGGQGIIQFRSESQLTVTKDDHFVLRLYAPMITIGGGRIIDPSPVKHSRFQSEIIEHIEAMESVSARPLVSEVMANAGITPILRKDVIEKVNLPKAEIENILKEMELNNEIIKGESVSERIMHIKAFEQLKERITGVISDFYGKQPLKLNIPIKEIKQRLFRDESNSDFFQKAITSLVKENKVKVMKDSLQLTQYSAPLTSKQEELKKKIESFYLANLLSPPNLDVLCQTLGIKEKNAEEMISILRDMGILVRLAENVILHQTAIDKATETIKIYLKEHENIKAGDFTKLIGTSRKYSIPLLEYLDSIKLTKRVGDVRILY